MLTDTAKGCKMERRGFIKERSLVVPVCPPALQKKVRGLWLHAEIFSCVQSHVMNGKIAHDN